MDVNGGGNSADDDDDDDDSLEDDDDKEEDDVVVGSDSTTGAIWRRLLIKVAAVVDGCLVTSATTLGVVELARIVAIRQIGENFMVGSSLVLLCVVRFRFRFQRAT